MFLRAARHGELDTFRGVSANVIFSRGVLWYKQLPGHFGYGNIVPVRSLKYVEEKDLNHEIEEMFSGVESMDTECNDNHFSSLIMLSKFQHVLTGKEILIIKF